MEGLTPKLVIFVLLSQAELVLLGRRGADNPGFRLGVGFLLTFGWRVIETGLVEEFFFRSFLQARLVGYLGSPLAGICLAPLVFKLAHVLGLYLMAADKGGSFLEEPLCCKCSYIQSWLWVRPAGSWGCCTGARSGWKHETRKLAEQATLSHTQSAIL